VGLGAVLLVGGNLVNRLIGFVGIAVLGRLLTPADFGIVALALVVTGFVQAAVNDQFTMALIRGRDLERSHFDTAFTLALGWGAAAGLVIFLTAEPIGGLLGAPETAAPLQVLALQPVLAGLRNPHFALFMKRLDYGPNLVFTLVPRLVSTAVAIGLAALWGSYWAMIVGALALTAVGSAITHVMIPRPLRPSVARWREMLGFGGWLTAAGIMRFAANKADTAIIGRMMDVRTVGLYNMGTELATMATQQMTASLVRAAFPGLAAVSEDRGRLWAAYLKVLEVTVAVMAPIAFGIGLVAEEAVRLLVGPQWMGAVPVIAWLAPATLLSAMSTSAQTVATVEGRTRSLFLRGLTVFTIQTPLLVVGIWGFGVMGAVAARTVGMAVGTALTVVMVTRLADGRLSETLRRPWRSFLSVAVMAAALLALDAFALPAVTDAATAFRGLVVKVVAGVAVYTACHAALWGLAGTPDGVERHLGAMGERVLARVRRRGRPQDGAR
jgi:PST family polysaccharide transporter